MSAYLVDAEHIAEIVKFAENNNFNHAYNCATKEPIDCDPKNVARVLAQANIDSLIARYDEDPNDFDGYIKECLGNLKYSTDGVSQSLLTGVGFCQLGADDIYNMIQCWNYQSCEVDNWYETDAYWLGAYIKDVAARKLADNAEVKWSYTKNKSEVA
tara:strand:- start:57 stop:527 length:471 start_codon:yes stop_codon:yes gene_type:complete